MAAKALARHRKALDRAPIRARCRQMLADMGMDVPEVLR